MISDITGAILRTLGEIEKDILAYSFVHSFDIENYHVTFSITENTIYINDLQDLIKDINKFIVLHEFCLKLQKEYT